MDKKSLMFMGNEWTGSRYKAQDALGFKEFTRGGYKLIIRSTVSTPCEGDSKPLYLASIAPKKKCGCSYKSHAEGYGKSEKSALADLERTIVSFRKITKPPAPTEEQAECPYCGMYGYHICPAE